MRVVLGLTLMVLAGFGCHVPSWHPEQDAREGEDRHGFSSSIPESDGEPREERVSEDVIQVSFLDTNPATPEQAFSFPDVQFPFDQATLTADARIILDDVLATLLAKPELQLMLEGHCDERGTEAYNQALGERRAQRVFYYLVEAGVEPARLRTISYGELKPVDPGHDEPAWARNRRVHFLTVDPADHLLGRVALY